MAVPVNEVSRLNVEAAVVNVQDVRVEAELVQDSNVLPWCHLALHSCLPVDHDGVDASSASVLAFFLFPRGVFVQDRVTPPRPPHVAVGQEPDAGVVVVVDVVVVVTSAVAACRVESLEHQWPHRGSGGLCPQQLLERRVEGVEDRVHDRTVVVEVSGHQFVVPEPKDGLRRPIEVKRRQPGGFGQWHQGAVDVFVATPFPGEFPVPPIVQDLSIIVKISLETGPDLVPKERCRRRGRCGRIRCRRNGPFAAGRMVERG